MTILAISDLEFAKQHLNRFADSDFFPPLYEYDAVWKKWDEFKSQITSLNVGKLAFPTPLHLPAPKASQTFRIVHQLDPLSCVAYTALAYSVSGELEKRRIDKSQKISCSYRSIPDAGSFFSEGTGYQDFLDQTRRLCDEYKFILSTDISDFYNQIYSHRVENSISTFGASWAETGKDIEKVIHSLNSQSSKGIPTGPNASIIFSEAILLDVDVLLANNGIVFCRFVDDFRIFSESIPDLMKITELLAEYLYDNHRLHLNSNKTNIMETERFLEKEFFNHYRIEVQEAFDLLGDITYGGVASVVRIDETEDDRIPFGVLAGARLVAEEDSLEHIVARVLETVSKTGRADLNLLKALLRRCRMFHSMAFMPLVEDHIDIFLPVFHDLMKTMRQLYAEGEQSVVIEFLNKLYQTDYINLKFIRYWADWLASQDRRLLYECGASHFIRATGNYKYGGSHERPCLGSEFPIEH